eukprot:CAMPEP_0203760214 /NCGR_PEP_ID=MMETSP0098-20131031/13560_1 /ASSEMBLY_ACC=CAM_ASM_000208 /TAXON_ID=96639 /ORGANISM=" , Strain NY0313808BC1" /LENGTH=432 /DNA_ID=CAMNT_0050653691 /DNA_START=146 /DNA_END=1441 /DNA_ORIENTATION=+
MPRKKPQSGKQKKEYLKSKRKAKQQRPKDNYDNNVSNANGDNEDGLAFTKSGKDNELTSLFVKQADQEVKDRRNDSMRVVDLDRRESKLVACRGVPLGFPKRPAWDANTTPQELDRLEKTAFKEWLDNIYEQYKREEISPFEHNINVWRQLWHACEKSDVVLVVADVRNPLLHIPRALYDYVVQDLQLPLVVCLTKTDLVSREHVEDWTDFLKVYFSNIQVVTFSSKNVGTNGEFWNTKSGARDRRKILNKTLKEDDKKAVFDHGTQIIESCIQVARNKGDGEIPTIGIVGHPNVGKSSVVNGLIGQKLVSVSRSCGHTKHWQTHIVERNNKQIAVLCDSPGLIFPIAITSGGEYSARHVFECNGLYPIPQIREAFSAIRLLAEHVPLELVYNLKLDVDDYGEEWSPYNICGTFADQKGYTLHGGGPDFHRA